MKQGMLFAALSYFLWGISPIYWKLYKTVPVDEVLAHRTIWTFVFMIFLLLLQKKWQWFKTLASEPRNLQLSAMAALLLGANWYTYTWAVTNNQIVEASLGYFINPLMSLCLGVVVLKEPLRRTQVFCFVLAAAGVSIITLSVGSIPWVSLILALTFAFYGLIKKRVTLAPAQSMSVESGLFFIPAFFYLVLLGQVGVETTHPLNIGSWDLVFVTTGLATGGPLVLFAAAAQRLKLVTVGILQYIAPSLQFSVGVFLYNETFTQQKLIGFLFIWVGLILFTAESLSYSRKASIHRKELLR